MSKSNNYKYDTVVDLNGNTCHTKIIKMVGFEKEVLDIGCATGYIARALKENFHCRVTGIDIDQYAARKAAKFCERIVIGDIENMDFQKELKGKKFDVVIFGDVLEHLRDPWHVLEMVRLIIKDKGYVVASIPNIRYFSIIAELLEGNFEYRQLGLLDKTHLRFFTKKSIMQLFNETGYEIRSWNRQIVMPKDSEHKVDLDKFPRSLISYFGNEEEIFTYQYIIKAIPIRDGQASKKSVQEFEISTIQELTDTIAENDNQIKHMEQKIAENDNQIKHMEQKIAENDNQIKHMEQKIAEKNNQIKAMYNSWSWRIGRVATRPLGAIINLDKQDRKKNSKNR